MFSFRDYVAAVFSDDANRFKNSKDYFLKAPVLSDGCNFLYAPLRNSNKVSDSGQNKVS